MHAQQRKGNPMFVKQVPVSGLITTNAYFYINELTGAGVLIDPGAEASRLLKLINDNHWIIEKILLTHGHFDHIGAVDTIAKELKIPYYIHKNGKEYLENGQINLSSVWGQEICLYDAQFLNDAEIIRDKAENFMLQVIHTPGHTTDSVLYYDEKNHIAFCGDTIFKSSYGRTDLPGGNLQQLTDSIKKKILTLPDNTLLYSGHSELTTVAEEKRWY